MTPSRLPASESANFISAVQVVWGKPCSPGLGFGLGGTVLFQEFTQRRGRGSTAAVHSHDCYLGAIGAEWASANIHIPSPPSKAPDGYSDASV